MERNQRCMCRGSPLQLVSLYPGITHIQHVRSHSDWQSSCAQEKKWRKDSASTPGFRSAALLKSPCRGFPSSPQFHLEFSGLIEELHRRVYYRLRNDPFHIWSSKELLVRSLWVHLSHMWSFLQNQYGYFSVWQVNMKYHIIIEKQSCTFKHTRYSYLWESL